MASGVTISGIPGSASGLGALPGQDFPDGNRLKFFKFSVFLQKIVKRAQLGHRAGRFPFLRFGHCSLLFRLLLLACQRKPSLECLTPDARNSPAARTTPGLCHFVVPPLKGGRRESRAPTAPAATCAKEMHTC